jgi:EAL domain-containing protein (putative c-di-GMP-specific phosphodiesterase class I)
VPVCVEGIESENAYDTVVMLGCRVGQGWYFGKAMPGDEAIELLHRAERTQPTDLPDAING